MKCAISDLRRRTYTAFLIILTLMLGANPLKSQLLDPVSHPKFVSPLPRPAVIDATGGGHFEMSMEQTVQQLGLFSADGVPLNTTVWGYGMLGQGVSYPGPTFETKSFVPVDITWHNNLPTTGHVLPTDVSLHMAHPPSFPAYEFYEAGYVPAVTHLHGGHTESGSDGLPEAWYTQEGIGDQYAGAHNVNGNMYHYDNDQEAATLWYHDHALGITRLNVYAGLAGFYLLSDENEKQLFKDNVLPKKGYTVEIVIQDRMFYETGELFLPAKQGDPFFDGTVDVPDDPEFVGDNTIVAEFFGNFIMVNGVAWPNFRVEPRKYRFRLLNGSDSRFYVLHFDNGMKFLQIGTDNGFLQQAVELDELVIAPGERADLIVDFSTYSGNAIILKNRGPDVPFRGLNPGGSLNDGEGGVLDPADPATTGLVMQFSVNKNLKQKKNFQDAMVMVGTPLRQQPIPSLENPDNIRKLALFEGEDRFGRLQPLLGIINGDQSNGVGGVVNGSLEWFEEITENPMLNDVEVWEIYNVTEDAHPIHLHLVAFQIVERRPFEAVVLPPEGTEPDEGIGGYVVESSIDFTGPSENPAPNEQGWKDTFIIPPGYMGKVIARFDRPGRYVWHCHILSHEDHEMMRPYHVGPIQPSLVTTQIQPISVGQNYPNPFINSTMVDFSLQSNAMVTISITDKGGDLVWTETRRYESGPQTFNFDALSLPAGTYYFQLMVGGNKETKRMIKLD